MTAAHTPPTGQWRVDVLRGHDIETTWHESKLAADIAEWRHRFAGVKNVVAWYDAAVYEPELVEDVA